MSEPPPDPPATGRDGLDPEGDSAPSARPSEAQRRYLSRGLEQPGGKLPLFDQDGGRIDRRTIESCLERGWAEPWFANPIKSNWLICRLTRAGYAVLGENLVK
jgi:hypothetical protein